MLCDVSVTVKSFYVYFLLLQPTLCNEHPSLGVISAGLKNKKKNEERAHF
jgi:hypothetical protein